MNHLPTIQNKPRGSEGVCSAAVAVCEPVSVGVCRSHGSLFMVKDFKSYYAFISEINAQSWHVLMICFTFTEDDFAV